MKIAQVAPIFESVPPKAYGGTERVVSYLTEELVRQGHEVTLFATGDSVTTARLVAAVDCSTRPALGNNEWLAYHTMQMDELLRRAREFDVVHYHTDFLHFAEARMLGVPHVTTMHGRPDLPWLAPLFRHFADIPLVAISDHQGAQAPTANWVGTVHHGLPPDICSYSAEAGDYFVFVGRVSPEKRVDRAIEIADRCGTPLFIAAKCDAADEPYFNEVIKPLLHNPLVTYLGEVSQEAKMGLLQRARALLLPIDWPEPFGLVMIEAFSCGTPVIAYRHGSVPEIIDHGVNGFIVDNQEEAVRAASRIGEINRRNCRATFERKFTSARMAQDYLRIYEQRRRASIPSRIAQAGR
jgi:glycosyltransferase involved in cell wall biosynthesis